MAYFCTACPILCGLLFNTYIQWMWHEFSCEHYSRPATYLCAEDPEICIKWYTLPAPFRARLADAHGNTATSDEDIETHLVGRFMRKYWCGFCKRAFPAREVGAQVPVQEGSVNRWHTVRALHILPHFDVWSEPRRDITEWVEIEDMDWQGWLDAALLLARPGTDS